jgi:hypothetical protein
MALQRVTLRLRELRCIRQSEGSDGSEPYLWVTYFAFGAQPLPFQTGPMATITPAYDAFRTEFPDNMKAGQVTHVPPFLATASFDMDLELAHKLVGCIAVLMEEDETPDSSIILGRIAYSKEIDKQLNDLAKKRILSGDLGPVTNAEINAIKSAVLAKVKDAIGSNQSIWNVFTNQDDNLGFTYKAFTDSEIQFQYFDFPEIVSDDSKDRFVLSGGISLGPVPTDPVDLCATPRAALNAKKDEITSLQHRVTMLQDELHHATPQQKPAIIAEIKETNSLITQDEAELPALQAALDSCISRLHDHLRDVNIGPTIVVNPD